MSTVRPMIIGPRSPEIDVMMTAISAWVAMRRSPDMTGSSRLMPVTMLIGGAWCEGLLRLYEFVVACAALRVIDLGVLRRGFQQLLVRSPRQDFSFHQQDDLIVIFDGRYLLRYRQQRQLRIV